MHRGNAASCSIEFLGRQYWYLPTDTAWDSSPM